MVHRLVVVVAVLSLPACQSDGPCGTVCTNGVQQVSWEQDGTCKHSFDIPCFPFACASDGVACAESCQSSNECATGASCNDVTLECAPVPYQCKDAFTVIDASGTETSCMPYRCAAGSCQDACNVDGDCATGYVCRAPTCVSI
jgi:hypothetical protein